MLEQIRFKVIADYPNNPFRVGIILTADNDREFDSYSKYPHLYQKLNWWEERPLDELPQYVKWKTGVDKWIICKIVQPHPEHGFMGWNKNSFDVEWKPELDGKGTCTDGTHFSNVPYWRCIDFSPATKEEYDQQF